MSDLFNDAVVKFPAPRPVQTKAMRMMAAAVGEGWRTPLLCLGTGVGKTYIAMRYAHSGLKRGKRVTFLCDRVTLIDQTSRRAASYGLDHAVLQADHPMQDWSKPFQIASVQTIASRGWPETDILIVDEAHTMYETWVKFAQESGAYVIGLTATPFTKGIGKVFDKLVSPATMHEMTEDGTLVPMRVLSGKRPDMEGAKLNAKGEWADHEVEARGTAIICDVPTEWLRHAENRKTIVFGATKNHCRDLCRQFNEAAGAMIAACFTEDTSPTERRQLLAEFEKPESFIRVLLSVEALAKGFDVPDVSCVVDCRPLRRSLSQAIQMWGRGLRTSPDTGKTDCLLLDHSGNIIRFADDFAAFFFDGLESLDQGEALDRSIRQEPKEKEEEGEQSGCPKCHFKPFRKRCMGCGFEIVEQSLIAPEAGEMQAVVLGKKTLASDRRHLWNQLVTYADAHDKIQRKEGFAKLKFKEWTGDWPKFGYAGAERVEVSAAVRSRIQSENIRRARGRAAA